MKVVFLDFDGVIVTDRSIRMRRESGCAPFDRVAVANLNTLIAATGANVVLSTSWRTDCSLNMRQVLDHAGVQCTVIGLTPVGGGRGHEIGRWLDAHSKVVERFVILDDVLDEVLCKHFADNLVTTTMASGFDARALLRALRLLDSRTPSSAGPAGVANFMTLSGRMP